VYETVFAALMHYEAVDDRRWNRVNKWKGYRLQNTADSRSYKYSRTGPFGPGALPPAGRVLPVKTRDRSHLLQLQ